ncbi:MAG: DNA-directed RNA polymerase specialized sigma subunit, sigma24 family [Chloroflexi bacterium]|nr:MAG: DNA-directed RNA polymerase specialized sigma subunit, sigma24 family [Chloroflexota bacterium]
MPTPPHSPDPDPEQPPQALDALWQSAPPIDQNATWDRVAAELPPPPRARWPIRIFPFRRHARFMATAAAGVAVTGLVLGGLLTIGNGSAEASLLERADELSVATTDALADGELSQSERDDLNALVQVLVRKIEAGDDLAELSPAEIETLLRQLNGVQASLASLAEGDDSAAPVVAAVATATATVSAAVSADSDDASASADDREDEDSDSSGRDDDSGDDDSDDDADDDAERQTIPVSATPIAQTFTVDRAGSVTVELSTGSLRIVSVSPNAGWSFDTEVEDGGREVRVDFRDGSQRIRFKAEIEDGGVRVETEIRTDERNDDDAGDDDNSNSGSGNDDGAVTTTTRTPAPATMTTPMTMTIRMTTTTGRTATMTTMTSHVPRPVVVADPSGTTATQRTTDEAALRRLVRDAAGGDTEAFASLYRRRVGPVSRYVGAILHDQARTEDAVAQTFVEAWQQLPRLREPQRFDAWLMRIAHNRAIDQTRRPTTEPLEQAAEITGPPQHEPEAAAIRNEELSQVRTALLALPDDQREALVLRHLVGLSHVEIARQTGRSVEASRALLHRAVKALRATAAAPAATPLPAASQATQSQ